MENNYQITCTVVKDIVYLYCQRETNKTNN